MKNFFKLLPILLIVCVVVCAAIYSFYPIWGLKGRFPGKCTITNADRPEFIVYKFTADNLFLRRILASNFVTTYYTRKLNVGETFDCVLGVNVFCGSCNQLQVTDLKIQ